MPAANGAGKTTFALEYLPSVAGCVHFINVDLIAAGLAPLAPERQLLAASRVFLSELDARIEVREDFAIETTLAGRSYLLLVDRLKREGWRLDLIYLALPSVDMSALRVAERVAHGGHGIPMVDIRRRFPRSLRNLLGHFSHRVDHCICFMNDGAVPVTVFEQQGAQRDVVDTDWHECMTDEARR